MASSTSSTRTPVNYTGLLFKKEGGTRLAVQQLLVAAVAKRRRGRFSFTEVDRICCLGEASPVEKKSERLPQWESIENNPALMTGFIFSLVSTLFNLKADTVLKVDKRIKALSEHDYKEILKEMSENGCGATAAAGGTDVGNVPHDRQIVPFVVFRIFEEIG